MANSFKHIFLFNILGLFDCLFYLLVGWFVGWVGKWELRMRFVLFFVLFFGHVFIQELQSRID